MVKKIIIITIIIQVIFIFNSILVNAVNFEFKADADKEELNPGDEVTITLSIDNVDVQKGINTIEAWLSYDNNIFENIGMESLNDWEITYNAEPGERRGKFLVVKMIEGEKQNQDIGKIKLKVKDELFANETEVKISKITSNDGENLIDKGEKVIKFKVNGKITEEDNKENTNEKDKISMNSNNYNNENDNIQNSNSENNQIENKSFFYTIINTGDTTVIISLFIIIMVIVINITIYLYRKNKKDK